MHGVSVKYLQRMMALELGPHDVSTCIIFIKNQNEIKTELIRFVMTNCFAFRSMPLYVFFNVTLPLA
jgi:chaperone required for assembly of F1-ATPase